MRFCGIFCLVLLLVLLPVLGLSYDDENVILWDDFVEEVHQQLEDAPENAQVVYTPTMEVVSYHPRIASSPIRVPQGKSLVLKGGSYGGLLIEAGDILLEDCEITASKNAPIRIQGNYNKQAPILLTIGEGTTIESHGKKNAAIETTKVFAMDVDLNIENNGVITSHDSAGVYIDASPIDWGNSTVRFWNHGEISAKWAGVDLNISAEGGNANFEFSNDGTIRSDQWAGLAVTANSHKGAVTVQVENQAGGSLLSNTSHGLWLDTYDGRGREEGVKAASATYLRNDGLISGQLDAVTFRTTYVTEQLFPLSVEGTGEYSSDDVDAHALQVYMRGNFEEKWPPTKEAFTAQMRDYVEENDLLNDSQEDWLDALIIVRTGMDRLPLAEDGSLYHWYTEE